MACVKGAFEAIGEEDNVQGPTACSLGGEHWGRFCGFHRSARIEDAWRARRSFPFDAICFFSRENSSIKRKERWSGLVLAAARKELLLFLELSPTCR